MVALSISACPQPIVVFTFHSSGHQPIFSQVVAIVMSPTKRTLAQKIIVRDSAKIGH